MEGGPLLTDWWVEISKEFVPYLNVTAQLDDKPDQGLLSAKGGTGFPTCFFLDPATGAVLNEWFSPVDADAVRKVMGQAQARSDELTSLRKDAEARPDDKALQASFAMKLAMMHAGEHTLEELAELAKTAGVDAQLVAEFDAWFGGRRVEAVVTAAQQVETREEYENKVRAGFHKLLQEGVRLAPEHDNAQFYYSYGFRGAIEAGDRLSAEKAFDGYKAVMKLLVAQNPRYKEQVEEDLRDYQDELDALANKTG